MSPAKRSKKEMTNEEVGVVLPMKRLVLHMVTILIIGLVPDYFIVVFYLWLVSITPDLLLFKVAWFIAAPLLFWALYFVYWGFTVIMTHVFLAYYDRRSPAEVDIVIKRQFKDKALPDYKKLHYYHMRGAVVKYSLWITAKCPIPSLLKRVLNYYGHNSIASNVIYENLYPGLEFTEIKDNAIMENGSTLSTHVVESLYGNLVIGKVVLGENSVVGINTVIGPGITLADNCQVGDNCMTFQNWPLVPSEPGCGAFFNGSPAKCSDLDKMFADGTIKDRYMEATHKS